MASKTKKAKTINIDFSKDRETKTMVRYAEDGDIERPIMLYLRNDQVKALGSPESISAVISAA